MSLWVNKTSRYIGKRISENFNFSVWRNSALIHIRREENGLLRDFLIYLNLSHMQKEKCSLPAVHLVSGTCSVCRCLWSARPSSGFPGTWIGCSANWALPHHVRFYFCICWNGFKLQDLPVWLIPYWLISTSIYCSIHFRIIMCFSRLISSSFFFKLKCNGNWVTVIFNHQKITSHSQLNDNYIHLCRIFSNDTKI